MAHSLIEFQNEGGGDSFVFEKLLRSKEKRKKIMRERVRWYWKMKRKLTEKRDHNYQEIGHECRGHSVEIASFSVFLTCHNTSHSLSNQSIHCFCHKFERNYVLEFIVSRKISLLTGGHRIWHVWSIDNITDRNFKCNAGEGKRTLLRFVL